MPAVSRARPATAGRHLGVRLDRELEASLQLVAAQTGCSVSACVRRALRLYLPLELATANGLPRPAQLMVDKLFTASRPQVRELLGLLQGEELAQMERVLRQWLELA